MGKLPDDACPYTRPFSEDFQECPTFLPEAASCANLGVGTYWDELRHRYAQCRLGDGAQRLARLKAQILDSDAYVNLHADFHETALAPPPIMPPR